MPSKQDAVVAGEAQTGSARLAPRPAEVIDRSQTVTFTFDGKTYQAHPGDTIASALMAAGVKVLSRSFKYHRPRGALCCAGHCPNCLVQVGDEPSVRACTRPVKPGMAVTSQNAWPSLDRDVMSLTALGDRFLPVGFYYKTFIRPQSLWPVYERVLRHAAGLGKVNPKSKPGAYDKQYLHADVVVVGGGPAGLSAALAAAEQGARVLLFDENPALGGHLRFSRSEEAARMPELVARVTGHENITALSDTTVLGWYETNWMSAVSGNRFYKIRAGAIVFATGTYEQPVVFDNNDLPGVMLGSAVQRLINLYGVLPGRTALVVTANEDGWRVAAELLASGATVAAIVDERREVPDSPFRQQVTAAGVPVLNGYTIQSAAGRGRVQKGVVARLDEAGQPIPGSERQINCDLIALSTAWAPANGLLYQAGGKVAYNHDRAEFHPAMLPDGIFAAGRLAGTDLVATQLDEGRLAGRRAAAYLGKGETPADADWSELGTRKAAEPARTSARVHVPGKGKQFVCFCEDVTKKDLDLSIAEGYDSIELLKRYSTISMGPCQGKMCSLNTIHLCAQANGWTIEETGTTTARPPMTPVSLGALAGQQLEPVQLSPVHDWHLAQGAKMMVAGLWLRPEHYGDPVAEVQAVRERVGLIDVSTLGKLRLTGPGVPALLDRIYINKWQKLGVGRVRYGVMCNDEGVILDDGVTARVGETEWYMTATSSGANAIYEWIQWWLQSGWGEGVHLTNVSEVNAAFNLAGPCSRQLLQELADADLSHEAFPYMGVRQMNVAGIPCQVMRIGFTGELSYEIHCPSGYGRHLWEALLAAGERFDITPFGVEAQRILRLEKGHIIVGQDTDATTDPLAADMSWAVKLDKPDFLGRRQLLRVSSEGPTQRLVGFKMATPGIVPEEGLQIVQRGRGDNLEIIGWVTSSRHSPTLGETIGLCWLPADLAAENGASFTISRNGSLEEAHVHHGAFYDPAGERLRM